ncbi:MAG: TetR/AcrR family transcriptional regulator [Myxococcota bacterium]
MGALPRKQSDPEERRKQILRAAAVVFAERGFHRTRVSDIARQAGIAHGLIYHYFDSKDDLLQSIFEDNWAVFVKVLEGLTQQTERPVAERIQSVVELVLDALEVVPEILQVMIREVSRSGRFDREDTVALFQRAIELLVTLLVEGQERGEIDPSLEVHTAAHVIMGSIETVCTGYLLGHVGGQDKDLGRVKASLARSLLGGLKLRHDD